MSNCCLNRLSKSFETVNHKIMFEKLQLFRVRRDLFDWLKTYLTDRKQFVAVDCTFSTLRVVDSGIPQGSNLGLFLFLLYLNDLRRS